MKTQLINEIDKLQGEILELSHNIHSKPELGLEEHQAVKWQTELLKKHGFSIEYNYCGLETAYKAVLKGNQAGPKLAFIAEYDCLPEIGHGCGHNVIASTAVGAAIGLAKLPVSGDIIVMGTPAEEFDGGKITITDKGGFDGIDFAMMMHPSNISLIGRGGLAAASIGVEFFGKAAHSGLPEKGINALTSAISLFNSIDMLRQTWTDGAKINGIITNGGVASNSIPDYTSAKFTARSRTRKHLFKMIEDIKRVTNLAAMVTGAEYKVTVGLVYAERYPNMTMGETFKTNMEILGESMEYPDPNASIGSSDIGNVSLVVPTIHEYLSISSKDVETHTADFAVAAISPRADEIVIKAAKGMAMTAYDIFVSKELQAQIRQEFVEKVVPNKI